MASQVEFWTKAGYYFIPLTVGMMQPREVARDSQISKVIENVFMDYSLDKYSEDWNVLKKSPIFNGEYLDIFPWEEAANIDLAKFHEVQAFLPTGMKIIAMLAKIFTLTRMLMEFENIAINLKLNPKFIIKVIEKVAQSS